MGSGIPIIGKNDLLSQHTNVLNQWDYEKASSNRRTRAPIMLSEGRSKN